jgi:hypothetical protein
MRTGRLEAFSDGVLAVIITIMVLELKVPTGDTLGALSPMYPAFLGYVLSFIYVGIYWNNHHHLMHTVKHVTAGIMWANLHLLFWLSLFPVMTAWAGHYPESPWPAALYGIVLLAAAAAWLMLQRAIIRGGGSLASAIGSDVKGKMSPVLYATGIGLAFVRPPHGRAESCGLPRNLTEECVYLGRHVGCVLRAYGAGQFTILIELPEHVGTCPVALATQQHLVPASYGHHRELWGALRGLPNRNLDGTLDQLPLQGSHAAPPAERQYSSILSVVARGRQAGPRAREPRRARRGSSMAIRTHVCRLRQPRGRRARAERNGLASGLGSRT